MSPNSQQASPVPVRGAHVPGSDIALPIRKSLKWWIPITFVFAGSQVAWLLSEREPNNKELTFAYRTHVIASQSDGSQEKSSDFYKRAGDIKLVKQSCERLADEKYRCRVTVMQDAQPFAGPHEASDAIYFRDPKGWRFSPIETKSG